VPFDQIVIVDDCSTDGSQDFLKEHYSNNDKIRFIFKERNGGQLSTFNEVLSVTTADIIFFLDADDRYKPTYLFEAMRYYENNSSCDFLFCGINFFGDTTGSELRYGGDCDLGCSRIIALYGKKGEAYIGAATSTLSMKREIAQRLLPIPYTEDWRSRADDCLVLGASIVGARKHYLAKCLVEYRLHSSNIFARRKFTPIDRYFREIALKKLFCYLVKKQDIDTDLVEIIHLEFRTIPLPTCRQFKSYLKISLCADIGPVKKIKSLISIIRHYACVRLNKRGIK